MPTWNNLPLSKPVILGSLDSLEHAAYAMRTNGIGSILVNDLEGDLIGILTDRDLAFALSLQKLHPSDMIASALRSSRLVYADERATPQQIIEVMRREGIRRVPLLQEHHGRHRRCLGMVTLDDLLLAGMVSVEEVHAILDQQLDRPLTPTSSQQAKSAFRRMDRWQQSYRRFVKKISADTGLKTDQGRDLTIYALSAVLRGITPQEGKDLLAQLPYLLQSELMSEIAVPDEFVTRESLLREIGDRFNVDSEDAKYLLRKFWLSLGEMISEGELDDVVSQLPREMSRIFLEAQ